MMADSTINIFGRGRFAFINVFYLIFLVYTVNAVMLKQECPPDEFHRSCWFYKEYTCWHNKDKLHRVMILPKRLTNCIGGCYCKSGYVRGYPNGSCILAPFCLSSRLRDFLSKLPA